MQITSKGQVTIPAEIRSTFGLLPHTEVEFVPTKNGVFIRKKTKSTGRGKALIRHMAGTMTIKMTTDEIMELTRGDHD